MGGLDFDIVLIEDNPGDVYLLRVALEQAELQFHLTVLDDGAKALAYVSGQGSAKGTAMPDLIVMDLNLPRHSGVEVLQAMRKISAFATVPLVVMSSSRSPQDQRRVEELGISEYLNKPPDLDRFMELGLVLKEILISKKMPQPL
jgi:CheY-like chemotaxis protein